MRFRQAYAAVLRGRSTSLSRSSVCLSVCLFV